MRLAQVIIEIERTRRKLYHLSYNNPDKLLKVSQELDLLFNEYFKLKKGCDSYETIA